MSTSSMGQTLIDPLRQLQADAWQRGEKLLVEEVAARFPSIHLDSDAWLDLICAEVLLREEAGELPQAAEYIGRFPQLAAAIERQFAVNQMLGSLDGLRSMSALLSGGDLPDDGRTVLSERTPEVARAIAVKDGSFPDVPGYQILRELGRGGMGVVYQARHLQLNRIVALKMIRDSALASAAARDRFRIEATAVARLQHPNIVQIHDYSDAGPVPFFALEYVSDGSLAEWTCTRQSIQDSVAIVQILARALEHAHREGIVHRDLKPANILLTRRTPSTSNSSSHASTLDAVAASAVLKAAPTLGDLEPKISDFGLAKCLEENHGLTQSAALLGTCAYMSPEQAWGRSRDVGPATDVHALGLILYELLTSVAPFQSGSMAESLDRVRFTEPAPPSTLRSDVPKALDAICQRCLRKEPKDRYGSARELADDLQRFLSGESIISAPRSQSPVTRRLAAAVGGIVVVAALAFALGLFPTRARTPVTGPDTSSAPAPVRTTGESFAFLVGVRSYRLPDQSIDLEYTESDVDELSRLLFRRGFPRKNIRLLTQWNETDNPELAPTGQNIRKQLEQTLKSCIPADTVIVAVTGMGGDLGSPAMYCYLPADGQPDQTSSMLSLADFYDLFRRCPARQKILLVDTCQTVVSDPIAWPRLPEPPEGMAVFFACSPNEASYEHASIRHGVFSYHVLRGLEGAADRDRDGVVTLIELVNFATSQVREFVAANYPNASQSPYLISNLPDSTPLIRLQSTN